MQDFIDENVFDRFCPDTIQGDFMKHSKKGSRGPRLYFSHFQNRLLCAFLLCTLIPIFIIGGISYAVSYNIAEDKILNASISADAQLHTQFDNRLQQVEYCRYTDYLRKSDLFRRWYNKSDLRPLWNIKKEFSARHSCPLEG